MRDEFVSKERNHHSSFVKNINRNYSGSQRDQQKLVAQPKNILHWIPDGLPESGTAEISGRNQALFSSGCWMQDRGFDDETIIAAIETKNSTFNPPVSRTELQIVLRQILKYPKGEDYVVRLWRELQNEGKYLCAYWDNSKSKLIVTDPQYLFDALLAQRQTVMNAFNREKALQRIADDISTFDDDDDDGIDFAGLGVSR
jgi:hypothetical protein